MAKVRYVISNVKNWEGCIDNLIRERLVSYYEDNRGIILARYGVNKSVLKKIFEKEKIKGVKP